MAEILSQCEICFQDGLLQTSVSYCLDCKHPLCQSCVTSHSKFRPMKGHKILTIDEYMKIPETIRKFNEFCDDHSEQKFEYVCLEHNQCICFICLKEGHKACSDITKIAGEKFEVNIQSELKLLYEKLAAAETRVKSLIDVYQKDLRKLQSATKSAQNEIKVLISKLNSYLDKVRKNIEETSAKEYERVKQKITKYEEIRSNVSKRKNDINDFIKYGTDLQICIKLTHFRSEENLDELLTVIDNKNQRIELVFKVEPPVLDQIVTYNFRST